MTLPTGNQTRPTRAPQGFTLVELIAVLLLLAVVLGLAAPSLSRFFRGRVLEDEAKRFLALTRHARNDAISTGVPLVVWVDVAFGRYGLSPKPGFENQGVRLMEFELTRGIDTLVDPLYLNQKKLALIEFSPDGALNPASLYEIHFQRGDPDEDRIRIAQTFNRLAYEIRPKEDDLLPPPTPMPLDGL